MAESPLPFIPEDIIVDNILVRVLVKSVGRFRCVSKPWRSLLSTPEFARAHLNFHTDNEPEGSILIQGDADNAYSTVNLSDESSIVSRKLVIPSSSSSSSDVILMNTVAGSCHGLVLFHMESESDGWSLILFNPITLETRKIPVFGCENVAALGYDSSRDDYKVFSISNALYGTPIMGIYSLKVATWRSLAVAPYKNGYYNGIWFVNDCLHWSATKFDEGKSDEGRLVLVAFNLASEEFEELPFPKGLDEKIFSYITILGGCLALMSWNSEGWGCDDFWVMKEYGFADSWTKYSLTLTSEHVCHVGVSGEDELVFIPRGKGLVVYNLRNGVWRNLANTGNPLLYNIHPILVANFRQSLISPNV